MKQLAVATSSLSSFLSRRACFHRFSLYSAFNCFKFLRHLLVDRAATVSVDRNLQYYFNIVDLLFEQEKEKNQADRIRKMASMTSSEYLLPALTYEAPPRLARKNLLNTIIEDKFAENEEEYQSAQAKHGDRGTTRRQADGQRSIRSASPVPSLTSSISSYQKSGGESSDFDDLYDMSDDDSEISPSIMTSCNSTRSISPNPIPLDKPPKHRYPSLVIPSPQFWPNVQKVPDGSPPRPPKIPLSPAMLSMLGSDLPRPSDTPSLVSSLNTDPSAGQSAPATPDMQTCPASVDIWGAQVEQSPLDSKKLNAKHLRPVIRIRTDDEALSPSSSIYSPADGISVRDFGAESQSSRSDSPVIALNEDLEGVELPDDALQTLRHLSLEIPNEVPSERSLDSQMQERYEIPPRPSSADGTPASHFSEYSLSGMSIPSPGGFFSSLATSARKTWCVSGSVPVSAIPPSSTTAENFYNCPWTREISQPVEQVIEVSDLESDGPPTARQATISMLSTTPTLGNVHSSPRFAADEMMHIRNEDYEQAVQESAHESLDRTTTWLAAQTSYMAALRETNPKNELSARAQQDLKRASSHKRNDSLGSPLRKAARFLETEMAKSEFQGSQGSLSRTPSIHFQAFQHIRTTQRRSDVFTHRHTRSDSLQSIRICFPHEHVSKLQGNMKIVNVERPVPHRPISMMPGKQLEEEQSAEQKLVSRVENERQALDQVNTGIWIVEATRFLNGGTLISSPIREAASKSPMQILDLAGEPNCDWAWHCARDFPKSTVFTATSEQQNLESPTHSGPRNHRTVPVAKLWNLPFSTNSFDVISARALYAFLKTEIPFSEDYDEYDLCLRECLRCLKPGGYLEFSLQDSEILNAGAAGTAVSVEFGFNLKARGYDPAPTKTFLGRLRRAGFDDIKRAWTVLPMGAAPKDRSAFAETPPPDVSSFEGELEKLEAVRGPVGSTADVASVTGLVGSWAWEKWMLRLQQEMGKKNLLEGVPAVLEEGKGTGAGWRCLSGWARKPL